MDRLHSFLRKLFVLPPLLIVLISVPSFLLTFFFLSIDYKNIAVASAAYALSAYSLTISVIAVIRFIRRENKGEFPLLAKIRKTTLAGKYLNDIGFRSSISLASGFAINLIYIGIKLFSGIKYNSMWLIALAVYYMLLAVVRFILLRYVRKAPLGQNVLSEYRCYRACGVVLLLMNQALAGIVIFMVHQNQSFHYPGLLIYVMATYAFYAVITALHSLVKTRRHGSPVLSAAKALNLVAAMVSILSLETAMIAQFGGEENSTFRVAMTSATGGSVCTIVIIMAAFMIIRSIKQIKKLR